MRPLLLNLVPSRLWILLGFLGGMYPGLFFLRADWPSGYGSLKRRVYRLTHISFVGLEVNENVR
jgi:hypothetical protein